MTLLIFFLIGLGTGLSGAMIPGPLFLFTCSQAIKKDAAVGLRIALGHIIIESVFVVLILIGFGGLMTSQIFLRAVSVIGGVALIVMGVILFRNAPGMTLEIKDRIEFDYGSITGGAFYSIISPGFLIWWSTIGFSIIIKSLLYGFFGLLMVALGHWLADFGWHWFVSIFVHKGKHYLEDRTYRKTIKLLALSLVLMGGYFFLNIR